MTRVIFALVISLAFSQCQAFCAQSVPATTHTAVTAQYGTLPETTSSFGAVVSDGWLYIYGGHITPTHVYSTESASGRFHRLNLTDGKTWEELPGGPRLQGLNLAAYGGMIYRVGGMQSRNARKEKADNISLADAARFDPRARKWEDLPPLPEPRSSHDVAVVDGKLFAVGGWTMNGAKGNEWLKTMAVLNLNAAKPVWQSIKQPFQRRALAAASFDHKLYVLGGFTDDDDATLGVQVFEPKSNTWSVGPDLPGPSGNGFAPAACTLGGALYVSVADGTLYRLDSTGKAWNKAGASTPRIVHRLAPDHSQILALGGAAKGDTLNLIEAIQVGPASVAAQLQPLVDQHVIAGAVFLIANKGKVLELGSVGYSSLSTKKPMQDDCLFWIASMTKSITATALMMLVDEGKVNINDPVEKYLPEFKGQRVADDKDHTHLPQHPITIKEVLSHTSGLIQGNEPGFKHTYVLKEEVAQYAVAALKREPGTKFEYNNAGINTAGRIIEVVSGMSYADFMQKRLFDPLGMKDTTFWPTQEQASRLAHSARFTTDKSDLEEVRLDKGMTPALAEKLGNGVSVPAPLVCEMGGNIYRDYANHYAVPAGGLYSTVSDLTKFCQMLLDGGSFHGKRYLSESAIKEMTSIQTGDIPVNPQEGYGLGWFVKKGTAEGPSIGSFGHRGARRPVMWVDPKNELVMIILVERFDMPGEGQTRLYTTFLGAAIEKYGKAH